MFNSKIGYNYGEFLLWKTNLSNLSSNYKLIDLLFQSHAALFSPGKETILNMNCSSYKKELVTSTNNVIFILRIFVPIYSL